MLFKWMWQELINPKNNREQPDVGLALVPLFRTTIMRERHQKLRSLHRVSSSSLCTVSLCNAGSLEEDHWTPNTWWTCIKQQRCWRDLMMQERNDVKKDDFCHTQGVVLLPRHESHDRVCSHHYDNNKKILTSPSISSFPEVTWLYSQDMLTCCFCCRKTFASTTFCADKTLVTHCSLCFHNGLSAAVATK